MAPSAPRVRIVSTGTEILHGLYPDTNAQLLSRRLMAAGFEVIGHSAAADDRVQVREALTNAFRGCELIVMTGGLGPTEDDLNRFVISELWEQPLRLNTRAERMMHRRFRHRGLAMPERNVVQAELPEQCLPLYNHWGTAPGFFLPGGVGRPALLALPGPPRECLPMFDRAVKKLLAQFFPSLPVRRVQTLHLAMVPESIVGQELSGLVGRQEDGTEVTLLASPGHIRVRILSGGETEEEAEEARRRCRARIVERLGEKVLFAEGPDEASLAAEVLRLLQERGQTLALAESCTGGWICRDLTAISGSSATLMAGYVTYSNEAKARDLAVPMDLIEAHGAVSEPVVRAMAEGARRCAGTDWAVSVSGVAGPGGGSPEKPVGTVWFGIAGPEGTIARHCQFPGDREFVRQLSVQQALEYLRRLLIGIDLETLFPK